MDSGLTTSARPEYDIDDIGLGKLDLMASKDVKQNSITQVYLKVLFRTGLNLSQT